MILRVCVAPLLPETHPLSQGHTLTERDEDGEHPLFPQSRVRFPSGSHLTKLLQ